MEMGTSAVIKFNEVRKRFGPVCALESLTMEVYAGEILAIVGPSGCGKTTALRLLAGLEVPDGGEILIGGRSMNGLSPAERNVAMVFQDFALYPHMTVYGNLAYPLKLAQKHKTEIKRLVGEAAEMMDIVDLLDRYPGEISGGQAQRVAIGKALVRRPVAFLLDEPLSNLDAQLQRSLRDQIRRLPEQLGITTVFVTHDQEEAACVGDRIAVLEKGRLQQIGTLEEIRDDPSNLFVAGFMTGGPINVFHGTLRVENQHTFFVLEDRITFPIGKGVPAGSQPWSDVTVAIRPIDIEVSLGVNVGVIRGIVMDVAKSMHHNEILVQIGDQHELRLFVPPDLRVELGMSLGIRLPHEKILVFMHSIRLQLR